MNKKRLGEHFEKLATFKVVAELKSVHRASSRLGLSQPAVSRTIKVLEEVLECHLMERKSKGIELTEDGQRLYEYAKIVEKTLEDFDPAGEAQGPSQRPFHIVTYDNIACGILSRISPVWTASFPQLSISVGGPNSKILGDLVSGKVDCALIAQPRIMPGLEYKKIFTERYGIFISRKLLQKNRAKQKNPLRFEDLKSFRLIAMPDAIAGTNKSIDRLLWEVGLKSVFSIDSYEVAVRLVVDGHGIGIMPYSSASWGLREGLLEELRFKEVPSSFGAHDIALCWNINNVHPQLSAFTEVLVEGYNKI